MDSETLLACQWPPTVNVPHHVTNLKIHGGWPKNTKNGGSKAVDFTHFKSKLIEDLMVHWPDLHKYSETHDDKTKKAYSEFWRYEWIKHGRFAGCPDELYFQLIVDCFKEKVPHPTAMGLKVGGDGESVKNVRDSIKGSSVGAYVEVNGQKNEKEIFIRELRFQLNKIQDDAERKFEDREKKYSGKIESLKDIVKLPA